MNITTVNSPGNITTKIETTGMLTKIISPPVLVTTVIPPPGNVTTLLGLQGPPGAPGIAGSQFILMTTDQAIGGHRVVIATETGCNYASASVIAHLGKVIGMTNSAWESGVEAEIFTAGEVIEPSWNWELGQVFLSDNGLLTQTPPDTGFIQQIGKALSPTRIILMLQQPIMVL